MTEDWQAGRWDRSPASRAQSLQRSAAPSCGACWAAVRASGGCFAATDLASTPRAVAMLPEFNHPVSSEEPGSLEGGEHCPQRALLWQQGRPPVLLLFRALTHHLLQSSPTEPFTDLSSALGMITGAQGPRPCLPDAFMGPQLSI